MSSKIYLFVFLILISCSNEPINEIKPKVIAYYTGNGDTINEFKDQYPEISKASTKSIVEQATGEEEKKSRWRWVKWAIKPFNYIANRIREFLFSSSSE